MLEQEKIYEEIEACLEGLDEDALVEQTKRNIEEERRDFEAFRAALRDERCVLCSNPISHFSVKKPCLHWLLKPKGFKKKHFPLLYSTTDFHHMDTYLRWVANADKPFQNINDLVAEKASEKFIEHTISVGNLEWAFSCSHGDRAGHQGSKAGGHPHFHFQMRIDGNVFINFNGFHLEFSPDDEFCFAVKAGRFARLKGGHFHGAGTQDLFSRMSPESLLENAISVENPASAALDLSTMIVAGEGKQISGDNLADMIAESKRSGRSLAAQAKEYFSDANIQTVISPGGGVPTMVHRARGRGKKPKST